MRYDTAIEAHIEEQYQIFLGYDFYTGDTSLEYFLSEDYRGTDHDFDIAREVATRVAKEMGELVSFGTFNNCREHGITVTSAGGWTFCVYEHRNSDDICIEGCPTAEMEPYGPYGGESKWDMLFSTRWQDYDGAANAMVALLKASVMQPAVTRKVLKALTQDYPNGL